MLQVSHAAPISFCMPEWAITKLVSSSLIGVWLLTGSPSFCAAHCSQRCFSIFLPFLISVRWTVACLLQLSHFIWNVPARRAWPDVPHAIVYSRKSLRQFALRSYRLAARPAGVLRPIDCGVCIGFPDLDAHEPHVPRQFRRDAAR